MNLVRCICVAVSLSFETKTILSKD